MPDVLFIEQPTVAAALLQPFRLDIAKRLAQPRSCPKLAQLLNLPTPQARFVSLRPFFFPGSRSLGSELWVIGFEFGTIACRFGLVVRHFECNRHPKSVMGIDVNSLVGLSSNHNGVFTE